MQPANLLFILSDQHARDYSGCYGHPVVRTPHLDRLAEQGSRFTRAYTTCPICVPARASLATGQYVHQIGYWDNAFPYEGAVPGWGHYLKEQGYRVDSVGKLHFRSQSDDNGFTEEIDPLHVVDGVGDTLGLIRDNPPFRNKRPGIIGAGPGDSTYLRYDAGNADNAIRWLADHAADDQPWVLFLSFVCPHPPYIAPESFYNLYPLDQLPLPPQWNQADWPDHPAIDYFRRFFGLTEPFDEATIRKLTAAYCGVCTYLDQQIGRVLQVVEANNLSRNTRILYTSDHGESLGARGLTGKFTMYEESAAIPFILAGPEVPAGKVVNTPISLIDCFPTILEAVGAMPVRETADLPGESLWKMAGEPDAERTVFSEYHAVGSRNAIFMLTNSKYKYVYYVNEPPQLFDLNSDPQELNDLAGSQDHQQALQTFEAQLRAMLDPEAVDQQAKAHQQAKIDAVGGEDVVRARGAFDNSPVPGEAPAFREFS